VLEYRGWVTRKYQRDGQRMIDIGLDFRRDGQVLGNGWASFVAP